VEEERHARRRVLIDPIPGLLTVHANFVILRSGSPSVTLFETEKRWNLNSAAALTGEHSIPSAPSFLGCDGVPPGLC
jgi:hypothetical protein